MSNDDAKAQRERERQEERELAERLSTLASHEIFHTITVGGNDYFAKQHFFHKSFIHMASLSAYGACLTY